MGISLNHFFTRSLEHQSTTGRSGSCSLAIPFSEAVRASCCFRSSKLTFEVDHCFDAGRRLVLCRVQVRAVLQRFCAYQLTLHWGSSQLQSERRCEGRKRGEKGG